jgi:Pectinacetylesterase
MRIRAKQLLLSIAVLAAAAAGCSNSSSGGDGTCAQAAPEALRVCLGEFGTVLRSCFTETGAPCRNDDAGLEAALAKLAATVTASCSDGAFGALSADALVGRLRNACSSEASSLAWRTYGGPQGAVWPKADGGARDCLTAAHEAAARLLDGSLTAIDDCLASGACDTAGLAAERRALADAALSEVESSCDDLSALVAVDPATYVARAAHQADCIAATGHADTGSLDLGCGPASAEFDPPRGEYVQVVVDAERWGTMCGDGSDYAFWVRLAPEGERLDRVIIGLQGGGVCLFEDDCAARMVSDPDLFMATDDAPLEFGIGSNDPAESPFASWTKVYLPYCNQDVFAGGGVVEQLGSVSVPRYGAVNLRAAIEMVRNVLWKRMDADGGAGFRPDELIALFGGWSAGGYGSLYNYHWLLDDLQWPRTAAFPDAGLALDNGSLLGVRGLGPVKIPAWGALHNLPPYCFAGDCAVGEVIFGAIAPRLRQVPEQQMLLLSNQKDNTQERDAFFEDEAFFINTMRRTYCGSKGLNGIHFYLTGVSDRSVHVVSIRPELWTAAVGGEVMRDWFWRAVTQPDTLQSRAEEGNFVEVIPGVEPFPCPVSP